MPFAYIRIKVKRESTTGRVVDGIVLYANGLFTDHFGDKQRVQGMKMSEFPEDRMIKLVRSCEKCLNENRPQIYSFQQEESRRWYDVWHVTEGEKDCVGLYFLNNVRIYALQRLLKLARKKIFHLIEELAVEQGRARKLETTFLANVTHELRTPLNAIVGFSALLAEIDNPKEKQYYLRLIEENNDLLQQAVSDILELTRLESGCAAFQETQVELSGLLHEIVSEVQLKWATGNLHVDLDVCPPYYCWIDTFRLAQVVKQLLRNAVKFTVKGFVRTGYRLEKGRIYFYVVDSGIGIMPEQQEKIFERFGKLDVYSQGMGLGLTICRAIVRHWNGAIGVISAPGQGAEFWFTVPDRRK